MWNMTGKKIRRSSRSPHPEVQTAAAHELSIVGEILANPRLAAELSAAKAISDAHYVLETACSHSEFNQHQMAGVLGVTDGRVSQILNDSEADLKVSTLARYLSVCGFGLALHAVPVNGDWRTVITSDVPTRRVARFHIDASSPSFKGAYRSTWTAWKSGSESLERPMKDVGVFIHIAPEDIVDAEIVESEDGWRNIAVG
jgi:transcriptional regulator with XRE-family HTH domain